MGFRINTNIAAMNALNNATMNNREIDKSLGRLSSGLRINTAADDASGMVIANSLRSQASSLGQAVRNGNDAIGLIQTADGALDEYSKILDTIKTKSIQAASDGQNTASRLAIQKDVDRLMEELDIIATTTSFNGQKLLSGTFVNKEFQVGANANESVKSSIASAETSQIGQTTRARLDISIMGENQLTLKSATTGKNLELESFILEANNDPDNGLGAVAKQINRYTGDTGISAKAIVEVSTGVISEGVTGLDFSINDINIGAINVTNNDKDGTLLTAINAKTTQTGVAATKLPNGELTLSSIDGRVIEITGDISSVTSKTNKELSTIGYLDVVQSGSSSFQITGADLGTATGGNVTLSSSMITVEDSTLSVGSSIASGSTVAAGSTIGRDLAVPITYAAISSTADSLLKAGSIIGSGSIIDDGTTLASTIETRSTVTLSSDMTVAAGSTLTTGTVLDAGTVLAEDMTINQVDYKAGTVLAVDATLTASVTLSKDLVLTVDVLGANAAIGAGSKLLAGTVLGADITTTGTSTLGTDMVWEQGSVLLSGSTIAAGSTMGDDIVLSAAMVTTVGVDLKTGSTLVTASILSQRSTIGGAAGVGSNISLNENMLVKAGSTLTSGTILKAGTVLTQDLTAAQVGAGVGSGLAAGTILGTDITTTDPIFVQEDMTLLAGSGTVGLIFAGSILATNAGDRNSVVFSEEVFTNLSDIDVSTLEGAMKALDTLSAAISNLDTIRSDLGSVQNQIVSTINNISITQVNVKAAESQIRDVDFAAESANFSKRNILAQSGSYAMSQANAIQQNVLSLLQ